MGGDEAAWDTQEAADVTENEKSRAVGGEGTEAAIQWLLNDCADVWFHDGRASAEVAVRGVLKAAQGSDLARALADALRELLKAMDSGYPGRIPPKTRDARRALAAWDTQEARE